MMKRFLFLSVLVALFVSLSGLVFAAGPQPTQPSITVLSPNDGETWHYGETQRIQWVAEGVAQVKIYIFDDNITSSGSTNYIIPDNTTVSAGTGYYDWTIKQQQIPNQLGSGCHFKIRIFDADNSTISDTSDNYFSIVPTPSVPSKIKVGEWLTFVCGVDANNDWLNITLDPNQWDIRNVRISPPSDDDEFFVTYHGLQNLGCNGFFAQISIKHSAAMLIVFDAKPKTNGFLKIHYMYGGKEKLEGDWVYEGVSPLGAPSKMVKNSPKTTTWGKIKS